jgi:hypothetical protein
MKKGKNFVVPLMTIALIFYLTLLTLKSTSFIDVWPLQRIFWETISIIMISLLSYILFNNKSSVIIPLTIQVFLVVIIPVLMYPNALNIAGLWDSTAHYSYTKWIVVNNHVDTAGNLYYSEQYGYHPNNDIMPAILNLLLRIDLGWCMNIVLIMSYLEYILFLLALLEPEYLSMRKLNFNRWLLLIVIFTLSIKLPDYYSGTGLTYAYVSGILYVLVKWITREHNMHSKSLGLLFIVFLGLLCTHLSTSIIIIACLFMVILISQATYMLNKGIRARKSFQKRLVISFLMIASIFLIYELYVDVFLLGGTLERAINIIYTLYIKEIERAKMVINVRELPLIVLLQSLINGYVKIIIILCILLIHAIILIIRWSLLNYDEKVLTLLLFASYPTWIVGWAGVGSFMAGVRAIHVISFLLSLNLAVTHEKLYGFLVKKDKSTSIALLILIILGFTTNFELPFQPTIRSGVDQYVYPVPSQVGFSDLVFHSITYTSLHTDSSLFLCLSPFTKFGLCDLMWQTPRIPPHGEIGPEIITPDAIIEIMEKYINKNIIVPQPLRDRLLPTAAIGYHSLYEKPFRFLMENGKVLVYNNGMYILSLV